MWLAIGEIVGTLVKFAARPLAFLFVFMLGKGASLFGGHEDADKKSSGLALLVVFAVGMVLGCWMCGRSIVSAVRRVGR